MNWEGINQNALPVTPLVALTTTLGGVVSMQSFKGSEFIGPALSVLGGLAIALLNHFLRRRQKAEDLAFYQFLLQQKGEEIARLQRRLKEQGDDAA